METDCSKIKRKHKALDWGKLLPEHSSDDDRPAEPVIVSKKNLIEVGSGVDPFENHGEDVWLRMKSDRDISDDIARHKKTLQSVARKLPDKGETIKANLRRHELELERRRKLQSEKVYNASVVTSKKNPYEVRRGLDFQETHIEDLKVKPDCDITDYIARLKKLQSKTHIEDLKVKSDCELERRNKLQSDKGDKGCEDTTPPFDHINSSRSPKTSLADLSADQNDGGASRAKKKPSPVSHCGVAIRGSLTDKKMSTIVNALVNVGITPGEVGMAAEVFYTDPVKVKVLFALPSDMRRSYVIGLLHPTN